MRKVQKRLKRQYINLTKSRHYPVPVTRDSSQQPNLKEVEMFYSQCDGFTQANITEPNTFEAEYDCILGKSRGSHVFRNQPNPQLKKRPESSISEPQYEGMVESKHYDYVDESLMLGPQYEGMVKSKLYDYTDDKIINNPDLARDQQNPPVPERMPRRATFQEPSTSKNNNEYYYVLGEGRRSHVFTHPLKSHHQSKRSESSVPESVRGCCRI